MGNDNINTLVKLSGGHPRTLELLQQVILTYTQPKSTLNSPSGFKTVLDLLLARYQDYRYPTPDITIKEHIEILYNAIFRIDVDLSKHILPVGDSKTWYDVMKSALLLNFYSELPRGQLLKLNLLALANSIGNQRKSPYIQKLALLMNVVNNNPGNAQISDNYEKFHLYFDVFRISVLYYRREWLDTQEYLTLEQFYNLTDFPRLQMNHEAVGAVISHPELSFNIAPVFATDATNVGGNVPPKLWQKIN